jgi:hypothetical protein
MFAPLVCRSSTVEFTLAPTASNLGAPASSQLRSLVRLLPQAAPSHATMSSADAISSTAAEDAKNRRSSKRVANAANGKKQKKDSDANKKIKKTLCVRKHHTRLVALQLVRFASACA